MRFANEYAFLSNMFEAPIRAPYTKGSELITWRSSENLYQAVKFPDLDYRRSLAMVSPYAAKKAAKGLPIPADRKVQLMEWVVPLKFKQNPVLMEKLQSIKGGIIEHNYWHDNLFGHCTCEQCKTVPHLNNLGRILMNVRDGGK